MAEPVRHVTSNGFVRYQPKTRKGGYLSRSIGNYYDKVWVYDPKGTVPVLMSRWRARLVAWFRENNEVRKVANERRR